MYWAINEKNNYSKRCEPGMGSFFPQNMNLIEPLVSEEFSNIHAINSLNVDHFDHFLFVELIR